MTWFDRAVALSDQKVNALQEKDPEYVEDETEKRQRNKKTFNFVVNKYIEKQDVYRRGHVEFVERGLDKMKALDIHRDLECYKMLLKCFPKEIMIPKTMWQIEFKHFPKQQDSLIDIMEQMERYGVIGDQQFGDLLYMITGPKSHAFRKFRRHLYWAGKFKNMNPFALPAIMPDDPLQLALLALKKMSVDLENEITVWKTAQVEENPLEDTFIASAQSPIQRELLEKHKLDVPLYVEGGFLEYLKYKSATYFVLRADADPEKFVDYEPKVDEKKEKDEDLMDFKTYFEEENYAQLVAKPSEHEQEDGTIFAMCVTGSSSKDSLITWIRYLQKNNPVLEHAKIVFTLKSPDKGPDLIEEEQKLLEETEKKRKQSL